jgi:hypothetical protein
MESGDSVPQTPWDFSPWTCSGRIAGPAGHPEGAPACCVQRHFGPRVAVLQCPIYRCDTDTLRQVDSDVNHPIRLCFILAGRLVGANETWLRRRSACLPYLLSPTLRKQPQFVSQCSILEFRGQDTIFCGCTRMTPPRGLSMSAMSIITTAF